MNGSGLFHVEINRLEVERRPAVMIVTIEQDSRFVSCALDRLAAVGEMIDELVVIYFGERDQFHLQAHQRLAREMENGPYGPLRCRWQELQFQGGFLADFCAERQVLAANRQIHDLIARYKCDGRRLQVVVSDARGVVSLLVMSAAMLNFDHEDQLWQLVINDRWPSSKRGQEKRGGSRPSAGEVSLIKVPTLPLGQYFASLRGLGSREEQNLRRQQGEQKRCERIIAALTPMQLEVLRAFARGLTLDEVSDRLSIEKSTIHSHKRVIFQLCREAWGYDPEKHLSYHFLAQKFGVCFQTAH